MFGQGKALIIVTAVVAFAVAFTAALLIGRATAGEAEAAATVTRGLPETHGAVGVSTARFQVGPVPAAPKLPDLRPPPVVVRTQRDPQGTNEPSPPPPPPPPDPGGPDA